MPSTNQILLFFKHSYAQSFQYLWDQVSLHVDKWYLNYFYFFLFISLAIYSLELYKPWRTNQRKLRKGFWLDSFYLFFNFLIFPLLFLSPLSQILLLALHHSTINLSFFQIFKVQSLPIIIQITLFFISLDFIQWVVHICLHRISFLWKFHKVHHSIEQMGFAAHFRFHWIEHLFYTPIKYSIVILLGNFTPEYIFIIHYLGITIGHLNHANINITYGPLQYIFNNPAMHIWHHAQLLPKEKKYGVNFGISLSIWDYLFKTAYIPKSGKNITLGFEGIKDYPSQFFQQSIVPFLKKEPSAK